MAYVYQHRRIDNNSVFYIGIGSRKDRANSKHSRNAYWHNIVNKTEYKIEIIYNNLDKNSAIEFEKFLILLHGDKLCNMTSGGEGSYGRVIKESTKNKIRLKMIGKNNHNFGKKLTKEVKDKISNSRKLSDNHYKRKKVVDIVSNKKYDSCKECAIKNNINYQSLSMKLSGTRYNNTNFKYID